MIAEEELRQLDLFQGLEPDVISTLAARTEKRPYRSGETIIQPGMLGDYFWMVLSGQVAAYHLASAPGQRQLVNYFGPGEPFGEAALWNKTYYDLMVEGVLGGELLRLDAVTFHGLLKRSSVWAERLATLMRLRAEARQQPFQGQDPDEANLIFAHRHPYALIEMLLLPALVAVFVIVILIVSAIVGSTVLYVAVIMTSLAAIVITLWVVYLIEDWRNDDFIVTTKRVIHIERKWLSSEARNDSPIEQVLTVTTESPTVGARVWGYKDLTIQTGSVTGRMKFTSLSDAELVGQMIKSARDKALARRDVEKQQQISDQLRRRLGLGATAPPVGASPVVPGAARPPASSGNDNAAGPLLGILLYLMPRLSVQHGDMIIWRRHWYILLRRTILPLLANGLLTAVVIWSLSSNASPTNSLGPLSWGVLSLFYVPMLAWLFWKYEDWRNDYYAVTNTEIIDSISLPLGLRKKTRRAVFDSVQNVTSDVPGMLYTLLRMGHVNVNTTGGIEPIRFDSVFDPQSIQEEIFRRLDAHRRTQREAESRHQSQEFGEWLAAYHDLNTPPSPPSS